MISIQGLDRVDVLVALAEATSPQGLGFLQANRPIERADAQRLLDRQLDVDYFAGRPIKINFAKDEIDPFLYDRDAGPGTAERVITQLKMRQEKSA